MLRPGWTEQTADDVQPLIPPLLPPNVVHLKLAHPALAALCDDHAIAPDVPNVPCLKTHADRPLVVLAMGGHGKRLACGHNCRRGRGLPLSLARTSHIGRAHATHRATKAHTRTVSSGCFET